MTAVQLLAWISAALLLQLAVGIGVVVRRRRLAASATPAPPDATRNRPELAWEGWREFRVAHRSFEDAAQSQCSFHLQPVDGQPLPAFRPGQFLTFSLDLDAGAAGQSRRRARSRAATRCPTGPTRRTTGSRSSACLRRQIDRSSARDCRRTTSTTRSRSATCSGQGACRATSSSTPMPAVPVVLIGGRHRHHADDEHAALVPSRATRSGRCTSTTACATARTCLQAQLEQLAASHPRFQLNVVYSRPGADDEPGTGLPARGSRGRGPAAPHAAARAPPVLRLRPAGDDGDPGAGAGRVGRARRRTSTSRLSVRHPSSFPGSGAERCSRHAAARSK